MSDCPNCGTTLQGVVYTEHCGPHGLTEFIPTWGHVIDVGDLYGNWDSPDFFVCPAEKLTTIRQVYKHKDGCCYWRDVPMADDEGWCSVCHDIMEAVK